VVPTSVRHALKQHTLPITCLTSLELPPRLVFTLVDVAGFLEVAAARALGAEPRSVQVVADVPLAVTLERLPPPDYPLVCALASTGGHPCFPSVVHATTVVNPSGPAVLDK
jgi:hypothetical protein